VTPFCWGLRPKVTKRSKLLNGIAAVADVTTDLYVNLRPMLIDGLLASTNGFGDNAGICSSYSPRPVCLFNWL
jgi:hypothetical protein